MNRPFAPSRFPALSATLHRAATAAAAAAAHDCPFTARCQQPRDFRPKQAALQPGFQFGLVAVDPIPGPDDRVG
jgi:hypothetical protein